LISGIFALSALREGGAVTVRMVSRAREGAETVGDVGERISLARCGVSASEDSAAGGDGAKVAVELLLAGRFRGGGKLTFPGWTSRFFFRQPSGKRIPEIT
jgi:hypothetical protein